MGRVLLLIMGFGVSLALVTGLLSLTGELTPNRVVVDAASAILPQSAVTAPTACLQEIMLPVPIPGTDLVAERLVNYEGPFIEDVSDIPVSDIAALVVRNDGAEGIKEAAVILEREGERYEFILSYILPGMSVMVLESSAAPYFDDGMIRIHGWQQNLEKCDFVLSDLKIEKIGMGTVAVTNLTDKTLENVILYHKNYLDGNIFIGGITYQTCVDLIYPGQTVTVFPDHYADGYSKFFYAE